LWALLGSANEIRVIAAGWFRRGGDQLTLLRWRREIFVATNISKNEKRLMDGKFFFGKWLT